MAQFKEFIDRIALVTGAGSGMGKSVALSFAREGAHIVVNDVDLERANGVAREVREMGGKALAVRGDVSRAEEVADMLDRAVKEFGTVHILINSAGALGPSLFLEDTPEEDFDRVMDINVKGVFLCCKAATPTMKKNGYGKIVNVASTAAKRIASGAGGEYAASKAAVLSLTRTLGFELAPFGINVNAVCPGRTLTGMVVETAEHKERLKKIPIGRYATAEDQAHAIMFLCSDMASYIVGQAVDVDGGILLGWSDYETYAAGHKGRR